MKSDWLNARGLTEETLKVFRVGQYSNPSRKSLYSNKILFPILRFADGVKVGYLARTIEAESTDPNICFLKDFISNWKYSARGSSSMHQGAETHIGRFLVNSLWKWRVMEIVEKSKPDFPTIPTTLGNPHNPIVLAVL